MRLLLGTLIALSASPASGAPIDTFCVNVSKSIDTLADSFKTMCMPSAGDKPGVNSALLIARANVFGNERRRKPFLILACSAAGYELNRDARLRMHELWFSDVEHTKQKLAFSIAASECALLQKQISSGSITFEQMTQRIDAKLVRRNVAK